MTQLSEENARLLSLKTVEESDDDDYDQISVVSRGGTRRHQRVKRKAPQKVLKDLSVSEPPPTNDVEDKLREENDALRAELHSLTLRFDKYQGDQDYQFSQVQEAHSTQQAQWAAALERLQSEHKREVDDLNEAHATQLKNRPKSSDSAEDYYKKFYTEQLLNHQRKVDPTRVDSAETGDAEPVGPPRDGADCPTVAARRGRQEAPGRVRVVGVSLKEIYVDGSERDDDRARDREYIKASIQVASHRQSSSRLLGDAAVVRRHERVRRRVFDDAITQASSTSCARVYWIPPQRDPSPCSPTPGRASRPPSLMSWRRRAFAFRARSRRSRGRAPSFHQLRRRAPRPHTR